MRYIIKFWGRPYSTGDDGPIYHMKVVVEAPSPSGKDGALDVLCETHYIDFSEPREVEEAE